MERKKMMHVLREAAQCLGSYDDFPTMPVGTDPMPCLSRNRVPQPFFLVSEHDQVVLCMAGKSRIDLPGASPSSVDVDAGEAVYVPAGQASRIVPMPETVQLRFKAEPPGWEAAVWFCERCGEELFRRELDASSAPAQEGYWQACEEFNETASLRTCHACGAVRPPVDLTDIRWLEVAERLRAEDAPSPRSASAE